MTDPAAAFTKRLGDANRLAAVPLDRKVRAAGLLPDPRWDGPRYAPVTPPRPSLMARILEVLFR